MSVIASNVSPKFQSVSTWITVLLAVSCGLIVANIYYAQPLIGPISAELGLSPQSAGLIVTMTQIGYGAGLLLIVPLGDLMENRRLVLAVISLGAVALSCSALSSRPLPFLAPSLLICLGTVSLQIRLPFSGPLDSYAPCGYGALLDSPR